eukprot:scaffold563_cov410-Prasinococcus_capsulatus_cf.AAC.6
MYVIERRRQARGAAPRTPAADRAPWGPQTVAAARREGVAGVAELYVCKPPRGSLPAQMG